MSRGWALIPESRREQGLMMDWSIARNTTLVVLDKLLSRLGLIDRRRVRSTTDQYVRKLGIVTDSQDKKVAQLSGGNQQKSSKNRQVLQDGNELSLVGKQRRWLLRHVDVSSHGDPKQNQRQQSGKEPLCNSKDDGDGKSNL